MPKTIAKYQKRKQKLADRPVDVIKSKIIDLYQNNALTPAKISDVLEVDKEYTYHVLEAYTKRKKELSFYKDGKAEILEFMQLDLLNLNKRVIDSLSNVDLSEIDAKTRAMLIDKTAMAYGIFFDKVRLERGQASENINVLVQHIDAISDTRLSKRKHTATVEQIADELVEPRT